MNWKRILAYVTASVDEEILRRNEYLVTENRILRSQIKGRIRLTDAERVSLAQVAKGLGRKALNEVAQWSDRKQSLLGTGGWWPKSSTAQRIERQWMLRRKPRRLKN